MTLYLMDWHYLTLSQWRNRPKYRRCRSHSHLVPTSIRDGTSFKALQSTGYLRQLSLYPRQRRYLKRLTTFT